MDTEQTQTETVENTEPTDADLIAASLEAGGAEAVDVEREAAEAVERQAEAAAPKPAKAAAATETTATEGDEPKIAAIIRAREKAFQERQEATDHAAQIREEAQREAEQLRAAARKQAQDDYEAELTAKRARFKEKPVEFLRELGSTDDIVDAVALEGTPQWKAIRAAEERAARAEAKAGTVDAIKSDFEAFKSRVEGEKAANARAAVERAFLTDFAAPDKAPYLHKRYDEAEILHRAHDLANRWNKAKLPFAHSDIAEYLEHEARTRIAGTTPPQVSGASGAQKVRAANGSRTLSAATGSERRASPKPMHDMSPDEERDALIDAAREARRTLKADT